MPEQLQASPGPRRSTRNCRKRRNKAEEGKGIERTPEDSLKDSVVGEADVCLLPGEEKCTSSRCQGTSGRSPLLEAQGTHEDTAGPSPLRAGGACGGGGVAFGSQLRAGELKPAVLCLSFVSAEFEVNIVVLLQGDHLITENFPLRLCRM